MTSLPRATAETRLQTLVRSGRAVAGARYSLSLIPAFTSDRG